MIGIAWNCALRGDDDPRPRGRPGPRRSFQAGDYLHRDVRLRVGVAARLGLHQRALLHRGD